MSAMQRKRRYTEVGAVALVLFGQDVLAQELYEGEEVQYELPTVVVTANRLQEPLDRISSSVTVVTSDEMEAQQARTVDEALRNLPGLDIVRSGSLGQVSSVFSRGASSANTLFMIDGVQVNSPMTGGFNFGNLTTDNIEKIEVVRGSQSTLYGSDAIGGVINIITKKGGGKPRVILRSEAGRYSTLRESAQIAGSRRKVNYALSLSRVDTKGAFENDDYENSTLVGRVTSSISENLGLALVTRVVDAEGGVPGQRRISFDPNARIDDRLATVALQVDQHTRGRWHHRLLISNVREDITFDDPADPSESGPSTGDFSSHIETAITTVDLQHDFYLLPSNVVTAGVEWQQLRGQYIDTGPFGDTDFNKNTTSRALYIQNYFQRGHRFSFTSGVRIDDHSSLGTSTNFRVTSAYIFEATDWGATKLKGSWGTGFRAPSINELFFPGYGNPDLEPEKSKSFEVGLEQKLLEGRIVLAATSFRTDLENLIGFDPNTYTAGNISEAGSKGIELTAALRLDMRLTTTGSYTFLDTEDKETGNPLLRRPKRRGGININYRPFARLNLNTDITLVGERWDDDFDFSPEGRREGFYPGYRKIDAALLWDAAKHIRLTGRVENLLDEKYDEAAGYPAQGRAFYGGLQLNL